MSRLSFRTTTTCLPLQADVSLIAILTARIALYERMGQTFPFRCTISRTLYHVNRRRRPDLGDGMRDYYFEMIDGTFAEDLLIRVRVSSSGSISCRLVTYEEMYSADGNAEGWNR